MSERVYLKQCSCSCSSYSLLRKKEKKRKTNETNEKQSLKNSFLIFLVGFLGWHELPFLIKEIYFFKKLFKLTAIAIRWNMLF